MGRKDNDAALVAAGVLVGAVLGAAITLAVTDDSPPFDPANPGPEVERILATWNKIGIQDLGFDCPWNASSGFETRAQWMRQLGLVWISSDNMARRTELGRRVWLTWQHRNKPG